MGSGTAVQHAVRMIKREELPEDLVGAVIFLASGESDKFMLRLCTPWRCRTAAL